MARHIGTASFGGAPCAVCLELSTVQISDAMSAPPAPPSTLLVEEDLKQQFLAWCTNSVHIQIHESIDLFHSFSDDYRGVLAKADIAEGTELLRIARDSCLGPATLDATKEEWSKVMLRHNRYQPQAADESELAGSGDAEAAAAAAVPPVTTACFTVLRVLHEQGLGDKSPFSSYLSILPRDHRIPLEWTDAELALLQGTAAEPLISGDVLKGMYPVYVKLAAEHPELWDTSVRNPAAFAKALNWVRTRGFNLEGGQPYMVSKHVALQTYNYGISLFAQLLVDV
jgi:hypothetical protein